ncbi:MAG: helix-turn-helix domain-containing protein [Actinomycetales bacterium]
MESGPIDNYRFEWLNSFLAVVDFGGFAAAAENTYRSQPRISSHVADLERHLGAQLFDRKARPVRLTEGSSPFEWCSGPSAMGQAVRAGRELVATSFPVSGTMSRRQRVRMSSPR